MADLYYYESGYFDPELGYFVYTADAESVQNSTSTMTVAVSVIKEAQSDMSSAFTQTATISHIEGADLFAFSEALLSAEVARIRDNNIAASSAFSISTDASRTRTYSSDETADSTIVIDNLRVRYSEAATSAAFSLTADVELVPGGEVLQGEATLTSEFTVDCQAQRKRNIIDCDVTSAFSQTVSANRLRGIDSNFESQFIQQTVAVRLRDVDADLSATATISADVNETVQLAADLTASATINCTISHIEGADLFAFTNASLTVSADRTRDVSADLTAQSSVTADVNEVVQLASSISSSFSVSAQTGIIKSAQSSISSQFSQSATVTKYTNYFTLTVKDTPDANNEYYGTVGGLYTDASSNIYLSGSLGSGSYTSGYASLSKFNKLGEHQWTKTLIPSTGSNEFANLAVDSSENFYTTVQSKNTVVKYDTSGNVVWRYNVTNSTNTISLTQISIDSSDNAIATGSITISGTEYPYAVKINSSGVLQWSRRLTTGTRFITSIVDGTDLYASTGTRIAKIDSTGAHVWTRNISINSSTNHTIRTITKDSGGNVYISGIINSTSAKYVMAFNSSGTKLWHRDYSTTSGIEIYSNGTDLYTTFGNSTIANLNPSDGSIVWQKTYNPGNTFYLNNRIINLANSGLYFAGTIQYNTNPYRYSNLIARMPTDGSGLPTLGTYTVDSVSDTTTSTVTTTTTAFTVSNVTSTSLVSNTLSLGTKTPTITFDAVNLGGYLQNASAGISSQFSLTGSLNVLKLASSALSTSATLTAQPDNNLKSATASLSANGFVVAAFGRIRPEVADINSAFTLSVSVDKIKFFTANLNSQFVLSASALDLDLAQGNLQSSFNLSLTPTKKISGSSNLSSAFNFIVVEDFTALRLYGDKSSPFDTAGYITSSGGPISHSVTTGSTRGFHPIWTNFWFRNELFTADDTQVIYVGGQDSLQESSPPYTYGNARPNIIFTKTSGSYFLRITYVVVHTPGENLGVPGEDGLFNIRETTFRHEINLGSNFDPTQWHNFHIPLVMGHTLTADPAGAWPTFSMNSVESPKVDGVAYTFTTTTSYSSLPRDVYTIPYLKVEPEGGHWGHFNNQLDIFLSRVWISNNGTGTSSNQYTSFPVTEFYGSTNNISSSGVTAGGYSPNIWLPFNRSSQLLDKSDVNPTWNYTAVNKTGIGITKDYNANLTSQFTGVFRVTRIVPAGANLSSAFTSTTNNLRVRYSSLAATITASISIQSQRNAILNAALTTTATVTASLSTTERTGSSLTSQATMAINAKKIVYIQAPLTSQSQLVSGQKVTRTVISQQSSQFTANISVIKTARAQAEFSAFYSELAVAYRNATGTITMESSATMSCTGVITADQPQYMFSQAQMSTVAWNVLYAQSSLSSTSTFNLVPTYLRRNESVMTATASMVVNNTRTRNNSSSLGTQFYQFAYTENSKITGYSSSMSSTSAMVTANQILRLAQANLQSTASIPYVYAGVLVRVEANLQVNAFTLTVGQVLNIDEYYQLKIPGESRTLWIEPESRILTIDSETRVNKIKGYPTP